VTVLARSLESLFARVHEEASRLEQFSDDIAHEIKNKLFSIESSLDVALHTDHTKHGIEKAKKMISDLSSVVDALLFFARSETGKRESRDIGEYIRTHLDLSDPRIEIIEEAKISKEIYPDLLSVALGNILSNALKFTPLDGNVKIIISQT
jgi:two-component system, OmpR family, heavy metal sensor histidine kinase CusS